MEAKVLAVRDAHPAWGARKIGRVLETQGLAPPADSTIHAILVRAGRICDGSSGSTTRGRFEKEAPNLLWQMDFKGQFQMADGHWCWPLTVIDDHSRFALGVQACARQETSGVQATLENIFRIYGLPAAFYVDNGAPWGGGSPGQFTPLRVWLLKLGVDLIHAQPYTPQSRGKNERFHRTFKAEVLAAKPITDLVQAQRDFDRWRHIYNYERPHQSLDMLPPISRYKPSPRPMPHKLPDMPYDYGDILRKVPKDQPRIRFKGKPWRVPKAFRGETVAIRASNTDGRYDICFGATRIATIDLNPNSRPI
jgi:transposase InsO family protein